MSPMRKRAKIAPMGHCIWPGCKESGIYYTGRSVGLEKRWGYYCADHEVQVAKENMEYSQIIAERDLENARDQRRYGKVGRS